MNEKKPRKKREEMYRRVDRKKDTRLNHEIDLFNPVQDLQLEIVEMNDRELVERFQQYAYKYLYQEGLTAWKAWPKMIEEPEVIELLARMGKSADSEEFNMRKVVNRKRLQNYADEYYKNHIMRTRETLARQAAHRDFQTTEMLLGKLVEKIQEDGIEPSVVNSLVSVLQRRAKMSGYDAPNQVEIGVGGDDKVFTADEMTQAVLEIDDFERALLGEVIDNDDDNDDGDDDDD